MRLLSPLAAALITLGLLLSAELQTEFVMLLLGRFVPGGSGIQAGLLALYAGWLAGRLRSQRLHARWRPWLWRLFSVVFFAQLALGLAGAERFLMTGELHLPVPAVILAGPIYRGEGFFMPILLGATLLLAGPTWCSHLCYFGCWDDLAARQRPRPGSLHSWLRWGRCAMLASVVVAALGLRLAGCPGTVAAALGLVFGLAGLGVMAAWSSRAGQMAHCVFWCPIGVVADLAGRLSPFRMRILDSCTACGACSRRCRYGALEPEHIRRRQPGLTCTLCGDCLDACRHSSLRYAFPGLSADASRTLFITLICALHAAFLGLARI